MKKALSLIICFVLIFSALPVFAIPAMAAETKSTYIYDYDRNCYIDIEYIVENGEATLTYYDHKIDYYSTGTYYIELPAYVDGYKVTKIGDGESYAFWYENYDVNSGCEIHLTIPNGVTTLSDYGLCNTGWVASVTLPNSLTSIGSHAFWCDPNLKTVTMGNNVLTIGDHAFSECPKLETVTMSRKLKSIGEGAFSGCRSLKGLVLPNSVTEVGKYLLNGCTSLYNISLPLTFNYEKSVPGPQTHLGYIFGDTYSYHQNSGDAIIYWYTYKLKLPDSLKAISLTAGTEIHDYTFQNCTNLTTVALANSFKSIGTYAFKGCTSLSKLSIPFVGANAEGTGATNLGYLFDPSYSTSIPQTLKEVVVTSATTIADSTFEDCKYIEKITYSNDITSIGKSAFDYCLALTTVDLGDGITSIGNSAFYKCKALKSSITLAEGLTTIGDYAFKDCNVITSITLPNSLTTIKDSAFDGCWRLKSIYISPNVSYIGYHAFASTIDLPSITIPNPDCEIKEINIAYDYDYHNEYTLGYDDTVIYGYEGSTAQAYAEKYERTFVSLGSSTAAGSCGDNIKWTLDRPTGVLTVTGTGAMTDLADLSEWTTAYRTDIKSIVIGDGITHIGDLSFKNLNYLTSVTFGKDVKSVGAQAFYGCTKLTDVALNDGLQTIEASSFQNCAFDTINLPSTLTSIGNRGFKQCSELTAVEMPDSVTSIGYEAFMGCTSLSTVDLSTGVTAIPSLCFKGCTSLKSATLGQQVQSVANGAFSGCSSMESIDIQNSNCTIGSSAIPSNATIYGATGSTADSYAQNNGNTFEDPNLIKGTCGDSISWVINPETHVLTLTGTGSTYNYTNVGNINPFIQHRASIKSIVIGNGITHLGNRLFKGLNHTTSVTFGKDVKTMGYEVFYADNKLTDVKLNEGLTILGALTFFNNTALKQISIPSTVTNIANRAFKGAGLTSVTVPDTVKTMGYEVFMNCASLESVDFSEGVSMLNPRMFENCTSLKTFYFTDNMCRIRSRAFYGCSALESITFENADNMWGSSSGEAKIASNAFEGCNSTLNMIAKNNSHVETYSAKFGFAFTEK